MGAVMAMFNEWFELLADVPMTLVLAWVGWFATGALIVMWYRRAAELEAGLPAVPRQAATPKPKPASRPASPDVDAAEPAAAPHVSADGPDQAGRKAPVVIGDPFGDLATLLDQPGPAVASEYTPPPATHEPSRSPADSPILSSAGSPMRPQLRHGLDTPQPGH
jgi:hypothetical protein